MTNQHMNVQSIFYVYADELAITVQGNMFEEVERKFSASSRSAYYRKNSLNSAKI